MPVRSHAACIRSWRWTIVRASFIGAHQIPWTAPAIPRSLSAKSTSTWFIFTDASHEPSAEKVTAGIGWNWNSLGEKVSFFSKEVTEETLIMINVSKRKQSFLNVIFSQFSAQCGREEKNWLGVTSWSTYWQRWWGDSFISCHTTSDNAVPILDSKSSDRVECGRQSISIWFDFTDPMWLYKSVL